MTQYKLHAASAITAGFVLAGCFADSAVGPCTLQLKANEQGTAVLEPPYRVRLGTGSDPTVLFVSGTGWMQANIVLPTQLWLRERLAADSTRHHTGDHGVSCQPGRTVGGSTLRPRQRVCWRESWRRRWCRDRTPPEINGTRGRLRRCPNAGSKRDSKRAIEACCTARCGAMVPGRGAWRRRRARRRRARLDLRRA